MSALCGACESIAIEYTYLDVLLWVKMQKKDTNCRFFEKNS